MIAGEGRSWDSIWFVIGIATVSFFAAWAQSSPEALGHWSREDGPIEGLSAVLYGLASVGFAIFALKSEYLRDKGKLSYFFTIAWAALMFIFMGEEISWGQRLFGFQTPEPLKEVNFQGEVNLHNLGALHHWEYRALSIMMVTTGLILPLLAMTKAGRKLIQRFAFPVAPIALAPLFIGAYLYGYYFYPRIGDVSAEVREFLMSVAMFAFAITGAVYPCKLFRVCDSAPKSSPERSDARLSESGLPTVEPQAPR